ncbi:hypothetical protein LSH36_548g05040 [Paralvinella palmiformis]|uniref:Uncharacterized protein n=1 Tax=Paralvinella palmiformis TaxID=53620 RepID=A0AAD9J7X4_9ANNE|nr:hypothetical protein LSH36_548g05040 [Paralvinella palmiformis]
MAGSFDITGDELETTYLRNGLNGETEMKLMSMEEPNSTTSADLYSNESSGMESNGASNKMGCKSDLAIILKWKVGSHKPRNNKSTQKLPAYETQLSTASHYSVKAEGLVKMLLQKEVLTLMVLLKMCVYCDSNLSNFKAMMLFWLIPLSAKKAKIGQTYLSDKTHLEIIEIIVSNEAKTVQQLLKEASFFIFVMARSFDITGDELETTYLQNDLNGQTEMKLMSMEEPNSTTSADLSSNLQKVFIQDGI